VSQGPTSSFRLCFEFSRSVSLQFPFFSFSKRSAVCPCSFYFALESIVCAFEPLVVTVRIAVILRARRSDLRLSSALILCFSLRVEIISYIQAGTCLLCSGYFSSLFPSSLWIFFLCIHACTASRELIDLIPQRKCCETPLWLQCLRGSGENRPTPSSRLCLRRHP